MARSPLQSKLFSFNGVVLSLGLAAFGLSGCTAVVGAGVVAGIGSVQERGLEAAAIDTRLEFNVIHNWAENSLRIPTQISIEVYEGRALLTGIVPKKDENLRAKAVRLTWKVPGIKKVYNEIQIADSGVWELTRDSWITAQLKTKVTFDKEIFAINYAIETVGGAVYLIGIAQNAAELERIKAHARSISYVQKIVSHVRMKSEKPL
jgi:osmotically-inducible protein OsmY